MFEPFKEDEAIRIQPQSGLGDLINALPYIEFLVQKGDRVIVATNHAYALEPYGGNVTTVPVEFNGSIPIIRKGFEHYKYNRYHEKDTYGNIYFGINHYSYEKYSALAEIRYREEYDSYDNSYNKYIIFAPPRAAYRHKERNTKFECAPDIVETFEFMNGFDSPVIIVGKNDVYMTFPVLASPTFDLRNKTDFKELCMLIAGARMVVSQVSAITTLAGLFSRPTKFLKAALETDIQHNLHVNGVKWPLQEVI